MLLALLNALLACVCIFGCLTLCIVRFNLCCLFNCCLFDCCPSAEPAAEAGQPAGTAGTAGPAPVTDNATRARLLAASRAANDLLNVAPGVDLVYRVVD